MARSYPSPNPPTAFIVGHMMHDVHLLTLMNCTRIDRVILQRAPCATHDLCQGKGTWDTWFRQYYANLIEAATPTPAHAAAAAPSDDGSSGSGSSSGGGGGKALATLVYVRYFPSDDVWLARPLLATAASAATSAAAAGAPDVGTASSIAAPAPAIDNVLGAVSHHEQLSMSRAGTIGDSSTSHRHRNGRRHVRRKLVLYGAGEAKGVSHSNGQSNGSGETKSKINKGVKHIAVAGWPRCGTYRAAKAAALKLQAAFPDKIQANIQEYESRDAYMEWLLANRKAMSAPQHVSSPIIWLQRNNNSSENIQQQHVFAKLLGGYEELLGWISNYEQKFGKGQVGTSVLNRDINRALQTDTFFGRKLADATNMHVRRPPLRPPRYPINAKSSIFPSAARASGALGGRQQPQAANQIPPYMSDHIPFPQAPPIHVSNTLCFEEIYIRKTTRGFFHGVPAALVRRFKEIAYRNAKIQFPAITGTDSSTETTGSGAPVGLLNKQQLIITIPTRSKGHYREMADPTLLQKYLQEKLADLASSATGLQIKVKLFDTSDLTQEIQVNTAALTDILICTHGAFEANVIYMREKTLLVEMRGK